MSSVFVRLLLAVFGVLLLAASTYALTPRSQRFHDWMAGVEEYFTLHPELVNQSGTGWFPYQRVKWAETQRMLSGELPPPGARWNAVEQKKLRGGGGFRSIQSSWIQLAPNGAVSSSTCPGQAVAGRMLDIEFDPNFNPDQPGTDIIYAAAAGGGLWKSTDYGGSWTSTTEDFASVPVGGIGVSRADASIIVIGTGEGTIVEGFFYSGVGILRSTNGGTSWTPTNLNGAPWPGQSAGLGFHFIEVGPAGPNEQVFLAGATDGLYRSVNSGADWTKVNGSGQFYDAKWKPGSNDIVYTCQGNEFAVPESSGVWRSIDGGQTWSFRIGNVSGQLQPPANTIGKTKLAISADEPNWLYGLFADPGLGLVPGGRSTNADLYLSTNAGSASNNGVSWTRQFDNVPLNGQVSFNLCLVADPSDALVLFAAGVLTARSSNGGLNWSNPTVPNCFKDHHAVLYEPGSSSKLWIAGDMGMFDSSDDGLTWTAKNNTLATLQFYDIGVNNGPTSPWVIGGAQDAGLYQWRNASLVWDGFATSADGTVSAIDASDGIDAYASIRPNVFLYRTTNSGDSWAGISGVSGNYLINALDVDPSDGTIYRRFLNGSKVRKSENKAVSWTDVDNTVPVWISISPVNGNTVWWVHGDATSSGVRYTSNNGTTVFDATPFGYSTGAPTRILAHPTNSSAAFVTFSGHGNVAHVLRTTNLGSSWQNLTGNLLEEPVNCIAVNPSNPNQMFVGTDSGVWLGTEQGPNVNWQPYGQHLPHAYIFDLEIQNVRQRLVAATHGRAAWDVDIIEAGANVVWNGTVYLDADFLVPVGATLTIQPGTQILVKADSDRQNIGVDPNRIEIIVLGRVIANGTIGSPIQFITTGGSQAGDWYGFRFNLGGCERWGYGYLGSQNPLSSIQYTTISNAEYGVKIENFVAPTLKNVQFTNIVNEKDIYLDRTDVFIPAGYWPSGQCNNETPPFVQTPGEWLLLGGTDVIASKAQSQDAWFGNAGKVDFIPEGKLSTQASSTNRVSFRPENLILADSTNGDSWGGVFVDWPATKSVIQHADFGFAKTPLFILAPDSVIVRNCLVHHFQERGIWVYSATGKGFEIDSCYVYRGNGLLDSHGNEGIVLDRADLGKLRRSWITLAGGLDRTANGSGIRITYGKSHCLTSGPPESLFVHKNYINGPGLSIPSQITLAYRGLFHDYVCGTGSRYVRTYENLVENWKAFGVQFSQCSNIQMSCNRLQVLNRGVEHLRDGEPSGTSVKLRENIVTIVPVTSSCNVRTDDALNIDLGPKPFPSTKGLNTFIAPNAKFFMFEDDLGIVDTVEAQDNRWYYDNAALADSNLVRTHFSTTNGVTDAPRVWVTPIESTDPQCFGMPDVNYRPFPQPSGTLQAPPLAQDIVESVPRYLKSAREQEGKKLERISSGEVHETQIRHLGGNPSREITKLSLELARRNEGSVSIEVFDISGRLVRRVHQGHLRSGGYRVEWDGYDENGQTSGAGIYFVRVTAKDWSRTLKLVRLR